MNQWIRKLQNKRQKGKFQADHKQKKRYRILLGTLLAVDLCIATVWYYKKVDGMIPDHMYLFEDQTAKLNWNVPLSMKYSDAREVLAIQNEHAVKDRETFAWNRSVTVKAETVGSCQAELKLFGVLPYKKIRFDVIEKEKIMPSGKAVGLYIVSDGIMVLGTTKIEGKDGLTYEPSKDILQAGDCIKKMNGKKVGNIDEVTRYLQKTEKEAVKIDMIRDKKRITVRIKKVMAKDGKYKIGAWLREDTEGIGTLSFVTRENAFAALGHGITDMDTGKLITLLQGKVYPAKISDIKKGKAGNPGELIGSVALGDYNRIGWVKSNTRLGITGTILNAKYQYHPSQAMSVGLKQEVQKGKAYILCEIDGKVKKYQVSIEDVDVNSTDNKGMVIRITDKKLLNEAGGIVQGMSGAPLIQKNKVIGAVTHVFVNDPTRGYATFVENMLN